MSILNESELERMFSKIEIDKFTDCWIWHGARHMGYGYFNYRGITKKTHRLMYEEFIGELPEYDGMQVLDHIVCENKSCCNPWHVELVKQSFNVLRANSISGTNARKTHCIHGHPLPNPSERTKNGNLTRRCIICRRRNRMTRYYAQKMYR